MIQAIINKNNYTSFLEIGVARGDVHGKIIISTKTGVDPCPTPYESVINSTSDEFFQTNTNKFDIIFIDGDHSFEQSRKDFYNSVDILNKGGTILLHDIDQLGDPRARGWVCRTWEEITQNPKFNTQKIHVPYDQDYMGVVTINETN